MKKQVAVIGLGRFGSSVAITLTELGHDVMAVDSNSRIVQEISEKVTHVVQGDATDERMIKELDIANFDAGIVAIGSRIENSLLATIILKNIGLKYVVAKAENELHGAILEKIGADMVVYPERDMGASVAHGLTLSDIKEYIAVVKNYGVAKIEIPDYMAGKNMQDLGFGRDNKLGVAVLILQRGQEISVNPCLTDELMTGDALIVAANEADLQQLLTSARKKYRNGKE